MFKDEAEPFIDAIILDTLERLRASPPSTAETPQREEVSRSLLLDEWDIELEAAASFVDRQAFDSSDRILHRWIDQADALPETASSLELRARTYELAAHSMRDQGYLHGERSALWFYSAARSIYQRMGRARKILRCRLMEAVCSEMDDYEPAIRTALGEYRMIADAGDAAVLLDRARATLWMGTALTKLGQSREARTYISAAIPQLEAVGRRGEIGTAYQKLAIAETRAKVSHAARSALERALVLSDTSTPLSSVRLSVAASDVLFHLDDREDAENLLRNAREEAAAASLGHQMIAIDRLARAFGL